MGYEGTRTAVLVLGAFGLFFPVLMFIAMILAMTTIPGCVRVCFFVARHRDPWPRARRANLAAAVAAAPRSTAPMAIIHVTEMPILWRAAARSGVGARRRLELRLTRRPCWGCRCGARARRRAA